MDRQTNKQTNTLLNRYTVELFRAVLLPRSPHEMSNASSLSVVWEIQHTHHSSVSLWACCCFSRFAAAQWHSQWILWTASREEPGAGQWLPPLPFIISLTHTYGPHMISYPFMWSSVFQNELSNTFLPRNCCCATDIAVSHSKRTAKGNKWHRWVFRTEIGCLQFLQVLCAGAGAEQAQIKINSLHQPLFRGQWQEKGLSIQWNALSWNTQVLMEKGWDDYEVHVESFRLTPCLPICCEQNRIYFTGHKYVKQWNFFPAFLQSSSSEHAGAAVQCLTVVTGY